MYLLDANIFITAKNLHYGFDFVPAFWDTLDEAAQDGIVTSTRMVRDELAAGKDELADWVDLRKSMFTEPDEATIYSMRTLAQWVANHEQFMSAARDEFLSVADFELVAHAQANQLVLVTHERPRPESRKKIFIPDACDALGVQWTDPYSMLRQLGVRFVLPTH